MRRPDEVRGAGRPLPEDRDVETEKLADAAQGLLDLPVHLPGREENEPGREICEQRLELETAPEKLGRGLRRIDPGHDGGAYPSVAEWYVSPRFGSPE